MTSPPSHVASFVGSSCHTLEDGIQHVGNESDAQADAEAALLYQLKEGLFPR